MLNFHTEYILDQAGRFLNEVDPVEVSENGIVNGASFNYGLAGGRTHKDLDIDPVKAWDPAFRKHVLYQQDVRYLAPKNDRGVEATGVEKESLHKEARATSNKVAQRVRSFLRGIPLTLARPPTEWTSSDFYSLANVKGERSRVLADLFFFPFFIQAH